MNSEVNSNHELEQYPFRKVAYTSYLKGSLLVLFGIIFLLLVKSDLKQENFLFAGIKISLGISFLAFGIRSVWKGYKDEYDFSLNDIFDPTRNIKINKLLGQRSTNDYRLAWEYANIFRTKNFSYESYEKGRVKDWQFIFYKIVSKKGLSNIFEYVPFPITNFISNQSRPVSLIGFFVLILVIFGFVSYLEIIAFNMIWINLFILVGLLTLWHPSKINTVITQEHNKSVRNTILYFIFFYVITILLYKPYNGKINFGLLIAILVMASIIIYTAFLAFKLIESAFHNRKQINVQISDIDLATHRVATQPNNIHQQFENIIKQQIGWYFKSKTEDKGGGVAGDQIHKGDFKLEYIYETKPSIVSTKHDESVEKRLSIIYKLGLALISLGLILLFSGILNFPSLDYSTITNSNIILNEYSPKILLSLFLTLLGIAVYFFGNRLIYEIYMFFNTEIFFESNLILFGAYGNYDEYKDEREGIKRKDTFTDFTPDIEVCKITSSVFIHPYFKGANSIEELPRFLVNVKKNNQLLNSIIEQFKQNLTPYLMNLQSGNYTNQQIDKNSDRDLLENN